MNKTVKDIVGGKWWKVDFHVHTPASFDYGRGSEDPEKEKNITPKEFLYKAIEQKLDCLVISDHNCFDWIGKLREAMREIEGDEEFANGITIFPAIEVNVNGNIHLLAIFSPDIPERDLERIFGQFGYDSDIEATTKALHEVMNIVIKNKGIAIPAHVDKESGLFFENNSSNIRNVLRNVSELLAFEVIGESIENELLKESKRNVSFVAGSDSHSLNTLGSRYTWVKMGTPSIEALRLALYDNDDGVLRGDYFNGNPNDLQNRMYIKELLINEAKYAGRRKPLKVEFSPWMTSIIGGRGTGKSSIVQFVRMILNKGDELPDSLKKEYEDFINISKTRSDIGMIKNDTQIDICIVKDGMDYRFRWINGEIFEIMGGKEEKAIDISERFPIRIFNQKQLFEMTKDPQLLLKYIDNKWNFVEWKKRIDEVKNLYRDCAIRISNNNARLDEKRRKEVLLREIENKIKAFETDETKKVLNSQKELLLAEQQAKSVYRKYEDIIKQANLLCQSIDLLVDESVVVDKLDSESKKAIIEWEVQIKEFIKSYKRIYPADSVLMKSIDEWFNELEIASQKQENNEELQEVIENLKNQGVDDIEVYPILLKQKDDLLKDIEKYQRVDDERKQLAEERKNVLDKFYSLIDERIEEREKVIESWNKNGKLKITLLPMGNYEKNEEVLRNILHKSGTAYSSEILEQNKNEEYSGGIIFELAKNHKRDFSENLRELCNKIENPDSSTFGKKFVNHIENLKQSTEFINEMFTWVPDDLVKLELDIGKNKNKFIAIDAGSAGQRTSAILTLLLQISEEPIIIDQPEDDLDTKNITDFIVTGINNKKKNQQIIVVTHNPNIVVNTNSEQVVHMDFAGGEINATHAGALQNYEIRDAICEVMEGGREALESRYYRITKALE